MVRRRFGYRRLHALLRRDGYGVNHKRVYRLYVEEKLWVRKRGRKRRIAVPRAPMLVPQPESTRSGRWTSSAMRWPRDAASAR